MSKQAVPDEFNARVADFCARALPNSGPLYGDGDNGQQGLQTSQPHSSPLVSYCTIRI